MVHLLVRFEGAEEKFSFSQDVITLGRVSSNTIQVKDIKASRNHCEIRRTESGWKLVDLESSNGTSVNGTKVNAHVLVPGDLISIGAFELVFEPEQSAALKVPARPASEPVEKTVVDTTPARPAPAAKPVPAAAASAEQRRLTGLFVKSGIAAAVLIAGIISLNQMRGEWARRGGQEAQYNAAIKAAEAGDLADAVAKLDAFLSTKPDADLLKRATAKAEELRGIIVRRETEAARRHEQGIAELLARQQAADAAARFESAKAQVEAFLARNDFSAAVDEAKRFLSDAPEGAKRDRMSALLKSALTQASEAWEDVEAEANALVKAEKYAEALALLADARDRFEGTRFAYDIAAKVRGVGRLSGLNAAYASGAPEMSAQAQESMMAVNDMVRARQFEAALKAYDKVVAAMPEKDRAAFASRREDIAREAGIFRKLLAAINSGEFKDYAIDLGGNVTGRLSQASSEGMSIEFKDVTGKGGTTGRRWVQVPGPEMLTYFRQLRLDMNEMLGLAAFCYDNRMPLDGADVIQEIVRAQESMKTAAYELIARVRAMGVPSDGFVYFERGWYTQTEFLYAKLDHKAKKGAELIGKIDSKQADQGYAVYKALKDDSTLTAEFMQKATGYFVTSLQEKRQGIMKGLQNSQNIANFKALQELKKELNKRRAEALRIIYDKTIYPDENHGIEGQPKVDDAVAKVRELWDKPLAVVARLDDGVRVLVEAGEKTNAWLKEMGEAGDDAAMEEYELLLGHVNETLNLKNVCLDKTEQDIRDYNKKVFAYNKTGGDTQMVGVELECAKITNEYREMMGRKCLEVDDMLGKAAKKHSQEMVDLAYFAHESPTARLRTPMDRAKIEGYTGPVGENIATGYGDARAAFTGWYNSSGHHRNMLSDGWNHIGLGCVGGTMWTENLGRGPSHLNGKTDGSKMDNGRPVPGSAKAKSPVRAGVDGLPERSDALNKGASKAPAGDGKAGATDAKKGDSPYKQPEGKCTGTTPYDGGVGNQDGDGKK
ncbi:MAG: FHA domain-containing protein [Planctomycetia bacterium]|nr:FHA domain-containing protein [Planctomycetia bacterium]